MLARPNQNSTSAATFPAPTGGVNAMQNLAEVQPRDALYCINLMSTAQGLVGRFGYREFSTGFDENVRTIIPFRGATSSADRLFAATDVGIYNITAGGTPGSPVVTWTTAGGDAGKCTFFQFTNAAGNHLLVFDEQNGYIYYSESSGTWTTSPSVTGVSAANLVQGVVWKNRIWAVERNTGKSWYLAPLAITGAATVFYVGEKFAVGSSLRAIFNWSQDAGQGLEEYVVFVSDAGEVLVYRGTDPDDSSKFTISGMASIGTPPAGRRFGVSLGGDLLLVGVYGVVQLSRALSGEEYLNSPNSIGFKINPLVQQDSILYRDSFGWDTVLNPAQSLVMVSVGGRDIQYVYNIFTNAWTVWKGLVIRSLAVYNDKTYFSDTSGRVCTLEEYDDNGVEIEYSVVGAYSEFEQFARFKRPAVIRPILVSAENAQYGVGMYFDYDLRFYETGVLFDAGSSGDTPLWDAAIWDAATWGGFSGVRNNPSGVAGIGRSLAPALRGKFRTKTLLLGFHVVFTTGGVL